MPKELLGDGGTVTNKLSFFCSAWVEKRLGVQPLALAALTAGVGPASEFRCLWPSAQQLVL